MGDVEAKSDIVTRQDLWHDRHTVSLLTDHLVFSPKYRGSDRRKPFFGKESFTKETCFQRLRSGVQRICGHHVVTTDQEGKAGTWWRSISRGRGVTMR
jgi:hypothetical protein